MSLHGFHFEVKAARDEVDSKYSFFLQVSVVAFFFLFYLGEEKVRGNDFLSLCRPRCKVFIDLRLGRNDVLQYTKFGDYHRQFCPQLFSRIIITFTSPFLFYFTFTTSHYFYFTFTIV